MAGRSPVSIVGRSPSAPRSAVSTAQAQQLEEIIVTAERRELNLQETPISVMSFEGEALELRGIDDMFELATVAPNLDIKGARGVGNTSPTFQIRGISGGGGATGERSVGFYIDNVFMPRTTGPVHARARRRARRGAARAAGHAVRPQQHRRRDPRVLAAARTPSGTATCGSRSATSSTRICKA